MITLNNSGEREVKAENGNMHGSYQTYKRGDGTTGRSPINATGGGYHTGLFIDLYLNDWSTQLELIPHAPEATYGEMPRISYATKSEQEMMDFLTNLRDALTTIIEIHDAI